MSWSFPVFYTWGNAQRSVENQFSTSSVFFRVCWSCNPAHRLIFYRRLTPMPCTFSIWSNMVYTWASASNALGIDFNLYSSWADLQAGTNAWSSCSFDIPGIAFPLNCAASSSSSVASWMYQASSLVNPYGATDYAYYILNISTYAIGGDKKCSVA